MQFSVYVVIRIDLHGFHKIECVSRGVFKTREDAQTYVNKDMDNMLDRIGMDDGLELNRGNHTIKYEGVYRKWYIGMASFDPETKDIYFG